MRSSYFLKRLYIFPFSILLLAGCTSNPFSKSDEIAKSPRTVSGTVKLSDDSSPAGVFVWLENFDLSTTTNEQGHFDLNLPAPESQPGGGVTGIFNLYFYVVNYAFQTAKVAVRNGEFIYSQGDIGSDGNLLSTVELAKLVNIETRVSPEIFAANFSGSFRVEFRVSALSTPVVVKGYMDKNRSLTGIILRKPGHGKGIVKIYNPFGSVLDSETIYGAVKTYSTDYQFAPCSLPEGFYEIIPFLWVEQTGLPSELLSNFPTSSRIDSEDYLLLPVIRDVDQLEIEATSGYNYPEGCN